MTMSERRPCPPASRSRPATRHFSWDAASAPRTITARRPAPASPGYSSRLKRCCSATRGTDHQPLLRPEPARAECGSDCHGARHDPRRMAPLARFQHCLGPGLPALVRSGIRPAEFRSVAAGRDEGNCGGSGRRRHTDAYHLHSTRQHVGRARAVNRLRGGSRRRQESIRALRGRLLLLPPQTLTATNGNACHVAARPDFGAGPCSANVYARKGTYPSLGARCYNR